ncbi:unnamed protein product [Urochloa humidicola]
MPKQPCAAATIAAPPRTAPPQPVATKHAAAAATAGGHEASFRLRRIRAPGTLAWTPSTPDTSTHPSSPSAAVSRSSGLSDPRGASSRASLVAYAGPPALWICTLPHLPSSASDAPNPLSSRRSRPSTSMR